MKNDINVVFKMLKDNGFKTWGDLKFFHKSLNDLELIIDYKLDDTFMVTLRNSGEFDIIDQHQFKNLRNINELNTILEYVLKYYKSIPFVKQREDMIENLEHFCIKYNKKDSIDELAKLLFDNLIFRDYVPVEFEGLDGYDMITIDDMYSFKFEEEFKGSIKLISTTTSDSDNSFIFKNRITFINYCLYQFLLFSLNILRGSDEKIQ